MLVAGYSAEKTATLVVETVAAHHQDQGLAVAAGPNLRYQAVGVAVLMGVVTYTALSFFFLGSRLTARINTRDTTIRTTQCSTYPTILLMH